MSSLIKIRPVEAQLFHMDERMDMKKLKVACHNSANYSVLVCVYSHRYGVPAAFLTVIKYISQYHNLGENKSYLFLFHKYYHSIKTASTNLFYYF